jgi:hypothetical protein
MIQEPNPFYPLEPTRTAMAKLSQQVLERAIAFTECIADRPVAPMNDAPQGFIKTMLAPPPEQPSELGE